MLNMAEDGHVEHGRTACVASHHCWLQSVVMGNENDAAMVVASGEHLGSGQLKIVVGFLLFKEKGVNIW
jgi:hypothetical protein